MSTMWNTGKRILIIKWITAIFVDIKKSRKYSLVHTKAREVTVSWFSKITRVAQQLISYAHLPMVYLSLSWQPPTSHWFIKISPCSHNFFVFTCINGFWGKLALEWILKKTVRFQNLKITVFNGFFYLTICRPFEYFE